MKENKENKEKKNIDIQEENKQELEQETQEENIETPQQEEKDPIKELEDKLAEANNKYLTLFADFENYRKRTNKQIAEIISNASEDMIKSLLPVLDDYERALDNMAKSEDELVNQMAEGMTLIYKKFYGILEKKGLKPIDAKGKEFDENLHEAITTFPAPTPEDAGKVIDETEKGYFLNNKVIRFSKVVVAQ